jgi:hypothetical protein
MNGYEKTYEVLAPRLRGCDFEKAAADLGLLYDAGGSVRVDFLRRHYRIDETGVYETETQDKGTDTLYCENKTACLPPWLCQDRGTIPLSRQSKTEEASPRLETEKPSSCLAGKSSTDSDSDVNRKSVLIYYLTSGGRGEPVYQFKLLHNFAQGIFSGGGGSNWMSAPLRKTFSGDPYGSERFSRAMAALGAGPVAAKAGATSVWAYLLLPKMPVEIYFYEADDEFPCEVKVMYDSTALCFVPFETLAVLHGCLLNEIKRASLAET